MGSKKSERQRPVAAAELVLVYVEEKPTFFARVEAVDADRKAGWWQVKLLILNVPLRLVTWVLDNDQIRGNDFTMGGVPVRLERVVAPDESVQAIDLSPQDRTIARGTLEPGKTARILAFRPKNDGDSANG